MIRATRAGRRSPAKKQPVWSSILMLGGLVTVVALTGSTLWLRRMVAALLNAKVLAVDPFGDGHTRLRHRREPHRLILWSVGRDGVDDGGPVDPDASGYGWRFEGKRPRDIVLMMLRNRPEFGQLPSDATGNGVGSQPVAPTMPRRSCVDQRTGCADQPAVLVLAGLPGICSRRSKSRILPASRGARAVRLAYPASFHHDYRSTFARAHPTQPGWRR
jgi:hypothetical protein